MQSGFLFGEDILQPKIVRCMKSDKHEFYSDLIRAFLALKHNLINSGCITLISETTNKVLNSIV